MKKRILLILLFLSLLAFRTFFGFSQSFFFPDELQTYLIGLRTYCEHTWPFFGPDLIVTETGFYTQLPGALEGILVGGPLFIWPVPEAPFILLNILSLIALAMLANYISKRVTQIPFWFTFAWLALLPWNLHESTNIINPSWLLFGSTFFFIGFLEAFPETSLGLWEPWSAFAAMGFGFFWDMQFHFSWILLPPFILLAFLWRLWRKSGQFLQTLGGLYLGSMISGAFLLSTWTTFGFGGMGKGMNLSVPFSQDNFLAFFTILARYFSLVSYEIPRFLGLNTAERIKAVTDYPLMLVPAVFLLIVGIVQPLVLLGMGFKKDGLHKDGRALTRLTFGAFFLVWISFWFTDKDPYAHIYYILLPLIAVYSFYIWDRLAVNKFFRIFGVICLFASLWFQAVHLFQQMPNGSLYSNRAKVAQSIDQKNYHLLGERRPGSHN